MGRREKNARLMERRSRKVWGGIWDGERPIEHLTLNIFRAINRSSADGEHNELWKPIKRNSESGRSMAVEL